MILWTPEQGRLRPLIPDASADFILDQDSKRLRNIGREQRYNFTVQGLTAGEEVTYLVNGRTLNRGVCINCGGFIDDDDGAGTFRTTTLSYDNRTALINTITPSPAPASTHLTLEDALSIAQLSACQRFEIPGDLASWTPVGTHCRTYSVQHTRSQQGEWLGAQGYDMGEKTTIKLTQIPADWMQQNYDILCTALTETPFYVQHSDGSRFLAYMWSDGDIEQPVYSSDGYCTFSFRLVG